MQKRDYTDVIGGNVLITAWLFFGLSAGEYATGTLTRMGPGYFPKVLGYLLGVAGVAVTCLGIASWPGRGASPSRG